MDFNTLLIYAVWSFIFLNILAQFFKSFRIVPQKYAVIVERLGKYHLTLNSGFHILIPFVDQAITTLDLKEEAVDVPPQECFTKDEVKVVADGVIYMSVMDPVRAAYGVTNYKWAAMQLAQTTIRSIIGKINLDKTFEEREYISASVVQVLEQTGAEWGLRVHRYEIKNIQPPPSVREAMEKQVRAERERRAIFAKSEGDRQSRINRSEGIKFELVNTSEGQRQKCINEAQGKAAEIIALADATAASIEKIALAINHKGGDEAVRLQLIEKYLGRISHLAHRDTDIILPMDISNLHGILESVGLNKKG